MTMRRLAILSAAAILAFILYKNFATLKNQQSEIDRLKSGVAPIFQSTGDSLELQDRCSKQAVQVYKQDQLDEIKLHNVPASSDISNHFSATLKHCFVELKETRFSAGNCRGKGLAKGLAS